MRSIALVSILLLFAACATAGESASTGLAAAAPVKAPAGDPKKVKVICTNEKTVGSNFSERVCRRVDQNDDQREATQRELLRPRAEQLRPGG
jgi:hypothetical protein